MRNKKEKHVPLLHLSFNDWHHLDKSLEDDVGPSLINHLSNLTSERNGRNCRVWLRYSLNESRDYVPQVPPIVAPTPLRHVPQLRLLHFKLLSIAIFIHHCPHNYSLIRFIITSFHFIPQLEQLAI